MTSTDPPTEPLAVADDASDEDLLRSVVEHYCRRLWEAEGAEALAGMVGASPGVAREHAVGLCDRTLGLRIPGRRSKSGGVVRRRLCELGVLRDSGHEALRGCVVVPVQSAAGAIAGLFGRRVDGRGGVIWAGGLPGAIFNDRALAEGAGPLLVAGSIEEALAVVSAGHTGVVAPGRPRGFSSPDVARLARRRLVVLGPGATGLAERLAGARAEVVVAGDGASLAALLASAATQKAALEALLADARPVAVTPATTTGTGTVVVGTEPPAPVSSNGQGPSTNGPPDAPLGLDRAPSVTTTPGADEVYVATAARSWRIRGARQVANTTAGCLRVTLSVTDTRSGRFHLDQLDLYVAQKRSGFLAAAAAELHCERDELVCELAQVLVAAEAQRDAGDGAPSVPAMTATERSEAMALLGDPELLSRIGADLQATGVVGEMENLLLCYLATISRLATRPLGVLVQSTSSAGKSTVAEAVCAFVPGEDVVALSAITAQALYYLTSAGLERKVLFVAEAQGAARAAYALKLLLSEGRLSIAAAGKDKATGRLATRSYEVAGPVALVMTTSAPEVTDELENRMVVVGADESPAQTAAVLLAQRRAAGLEGLLARSATERLRRLHQNAQRLLSAYPVVVPDGAPGLTANATRQRRDHQKLLCVTTALTLLHQHQREHRTVTISGEEVTYLCATEDDLARAASLLWAVNGPATDLAPQPRRLYEAVLAYARRVAGPEGATLGDIAFTRRELRELLGWSDRQVRSATERLVALEYLMVSGGGRGRLRTYHLGPPLLGPGPLGPGPVGTSSPPVRPPQGRTEPGLPPGATDELARFAPVPEIHGGDGIVGAGVVGADGDGARSR